MQSNHYTELLEITPILMVKQNVLEQQIFAHTPLRETPIQPIGDPTQTQVTCVHYVR